MIFQHWGSTNAEIDSAVVGDDLCPNAHVSATRSITLAAPPDEVFPWIRQMGFGRAGWYSYDWIDNLGRKSATSIHDEWQQVRSGDLIPAGPISFVAAIVEPPRAFVLQITSGNPVRPWLQFTLAYELRAVGDSTRLITRMRSHISVPGGSLFERLVLAPGDGLMVRRQLLNLASRINRIN